MGQYANNPTHIGKHVKVRLYQDGQPQDIIEAENIEWQPVLVPVESAPLSVGFTQHDTYPDGATATITGVKKGNAFLKKVKDIVKAANASGKPLPKLTANIDYRDIATNTTESIKIADATLMEINAFASGGNFDKQTEGFQLRGQLK